MGKHKNGRQLSVWISDELYKECEQNRMRSQSKINKTDYVTAALEFYNKHLKDDTTMEYVNENVFAELYNKLQNMEDNLIIINSLNKFLHCGEFVILLYHNITKKAIIIQSVKSLAHSKCKIISIQSVKSLAFFYILYL